MNVLKCCPKRYAIVEFIEIGCQKIGLIIVNLKPYIGNILYNY